MGRIYDVYSTGNITATGDYVGGLFGTRTADVERSYSSSQVISTGSLVGGLIGEYRDGDLIDSFFVGNVSGVDIGNTRVGLLIGVEDAGGTFNHSGNYVLNTSTCTNNAGGDTCNITGYATQGPLSYYYDSTNPPMNQWDFTTLWIDNITALPSF